MTDLIKGRCSACHAPAVRDSSDVWRHVGTACGREDAWLEVERQQPPPRDRQIRHPRRDR